MTAGILTGQLVLNWALVTVSRRVMVKMLPS